MTKVLRLSWRFDVLGKENAEERVEGHGKAQESKKGEEKLNEREKEGIGDERTRRNTTSLPSTQHSQPAKKP